MSPIRRKSVHKPTKVEIQVKLIVDSFQAKGIDIGVAWTGKDGLDFIYEEHVILVRDAYVEQVRAIIGRREKTHERDDGFIDGVTLLSLDGAEISGVIAAAEAIDRRLGVGVATPNHVLSICPVASCPATEPGVVAGDAVPDPAACDCGGQGAFIYVPDTGWLAGAGDHPWLAGVTGAPDPMYTPATSGSPAAIREYGGHGTFVAGVARCMAPVSTVEVGRDFDTAGAITEYLIVKQLDQALGLAPDIISLSAGATTRKDLPLLSFECFWLRYRHYKGMVLVAAAGNNGTRRPFWPAAFPEVVGVGALAANWRSRAHFSDYGPWVDVYAPGEDLVNAYATGTYKYVEPPNIGKEGEFHGMARWSGTSFSTPLVSGLIAARISRTGENARLAADALLALARGQALPGVGPVLWPCQTGDDCCGHAGCGCRPGCGGSGCGGSGPRAGRR